MTDLKSKTRHHAGRRLTFVRDLTRCLFALCLAACGAASSGSEQDFTIRSTVSATYGGRPVGGSSVLFQRQVWRQSNDTRGEATVLHPGGAKRAYLVTLDDTYTHIDTGIFQTTFNLNPHSCRQAGP